MPSPHMHYELILDLIQVFLEQKLATVSSLQFHVLPGRNIFFIENLSTARDRVRDSCLQSSESANIPQRADEISNI